jgi:tetratricopeptide (TPR) repeat protein
MAVAYYSLSNMRIEPAQAMSSAKAAAKALELDAGLAEAHVSLAMAHAFYDWDWRAAEHEFAEAIRLNPGSADAHAWCGTYLALIGRLDESTRELEQARRLDPLSLLINYTLALPLYFAGRYDQVIEQARKTLDLDEGFYLARVGLGTAFEEKGEFGKAIAEFERAQQLDDSPEILAFLARTYAVAGQRAEARRMLGQLLAIEKERYVSPYDLALVYEGLGDKVQALRLLERAYQTRAEGIISLRLDPRLAGLRSEPTFQELVRRMNFPP